MKYIYLLLTPLFMIFSSTQETTTIYLIRHAEKADTSPDTELSEAGKARAQRWKDYFIDKDITAIYSTAYKRTTGTAEPLAKANGITITTYGPPAIDLQTIANKHTGKATLIVGHSNTIPKYVNKLLQQDIYPDISENEFGNLYIITIRGNTVTHRLEKL